MIGGLFRQPPPPCQALTAWLKERTMSNPSTSDEAALRGALAQAAIARVEAEARAQIASEANVRAQGEAALAQERELEAYNALLGYLTRSK